jgi:hypothetical protein
MKKLLNEVLPDPTLKSVGSPRERTKAHLGRIVAAAAALQLGTAVADNTVPGDKGKDGKDKQTQGTPQKPPEPPSYGVVDPMPPPYINRNEGAAFITVESDPPGALVLIDGMSVGNTPLTKFQVSPGSHAVSVSSADGKITKNATLKVKKDKTAKQSFDLKPPKSKK